MVTAPGGVSALEVNEQTCVGRYVSLTFVLLNVHEKWRRWPEVSPGIRRADDVLPQMTTGRSSHPEQLKMFTVTDEIGNVIIQLWCITEMKLHNSSQTTAFIIPTTWRTPAHKPRQSFQNKKDNLNIDSVINRENYWNYRPWWGKHSVILIKVAIL